MASEESSAEMPKTWADQIRLRQAWKYTRGAGVKIALLDTGVAPCVGLRHVEQEVFNKRRGDHNGHGTATAALIGAKRSRGRRFFGVAHEAELIAYSVSNPGLDPRKMYAAAPVERAIRAALEREVDLICCPFHIGRVDGSFAEAIAEAAAAHVPVLVSAGNNPSARPGFPSQDQPVIHVGAVDRRGRTIYRWRPWMSVSGPGKAIRTMLRNGNLTEVFWGTSAAAPIVTGIAALGIALARERDPSGELALELRRELATRLTETAANSRTRLVDPLSFLASIPRS